MAKRGLTAFLKKASLSEVYLQSLVTTNVFLGLQTIHLAKAPTKRTKATSHTYS